MAVWFDVTSLYAWSRPVTGVTRVELECARVFLEICPLTVQFVQFDSQRQRFLARDSSELRERLAFLETLEGRPSGRGRRVLKKLLALLPDRMQTNVLRLSSLPRRLSQRLRLWRSSDLSSQVPDTIFQDGDTFLSLGFDLASQKFKAIAQIRKRSDLWVMTCCHDLIPWVRSDLTLDRIISPFLEYINELLEISDHVVCNSRCTAMDLSRYLELKARRPPISVIRLGSKVGFNPELPPSLSIATILEQPYVLFVSTIERRKNHEILLDAYHGLLAEGLSNLPKLVFVGMQGWGAEQFFQKLSSDPAVADHVRLLHHVSDHDLSHLYRRSLFTVYPSLYEGWGLPVAESLAQGKFCIASRAASIPEVGGDLVEYCAPDDARAWGVAIHAFANDPQALMAREERIRMEYHPPEWRDTVHQIMQVALPQGVT